MTNRILQFIFASPLIILMAIIVFINVKINYKSEVQIVQGDTIHQETLLQLRGLKHSLKANVDAEMQSLYPEGYVFLNALYALAWADFITTRNHSQYKDEGKAEIGRAWLKINSETGFGSLPIVDAFITWGDASIKPKWKHSSFVRFRIFSLIVFGIVAVLFWMFVEPGSNDGKGKMIVKW